MENFQSWSDEKVLLTAMKYGEEARKWRNRFLGLLPEIQRRKLYEKHGCTSIIEFAKKVGGVSENQVYTALRIDHELVETPTLRELFVSGEVSMHKMERVVAVASLDNEDFLVDQVQLLSKSALDALVKDIKYDQKKSSDVRKQPLPTVPETTQVAVQLDPEVAKELLSLRDSGIDINVELRGFLEQRKGKLEEAKEAMATTEESRQTKTRYIPVRTRKILVQEYGTMCSITNCTKQAEQIHHVRRYSIDPSHDPKYLAPLCKQHHEMAHAVDVRVQSRKRK